MDSVLARRRRQEADQEADQSRAQTRGRARASPEKKRTRKQTKTEGMVNSQELTEADMVDGATAWHGPQPQYAKTPKGNKLRPVRDDPKTQSFVVIEAQRQGAARSFELTVAICYEGMDEKEKAKALLEAFKQWLHGVTTTYAHVLYTRITSKNGARRARLRNALLEVAARMKDGEFKWKGMEHWRKECEREQAILDTEGDVTMVQALDEGLRKLCSKKGFKLFGANGKPISFADAAKVIRNPKKGALHMADDSHAKENEEARTGFGGARRSIRTWRDNFKGWLNEHFGYEGFFEKMALKAFDYGLSKDTIKNLVKHRFFQTDHILGTICDDLENFFLMPAPLNNRFDFQTRQNFKKKYTGPAWTSVRLFVKQALALQRKSGRY